MSALTPLIHPAYFGNIALWSLIVKAEKICFEAADNYQKQTFRNRMYIAHSNGRLALNIPVKHNKDGKRQRTKEVRIEQSFRWQRDHWRSLEAGYRSSPFFEYYEDDLSPFFSQQHQELFAHNIASMKLVATLLDLPFNFMLTSAYTPEILDENLNDYRSLVLAKKTKEVVMPQYLQVHQQNHGFLPNLSVLDLIFNLGPESQLYLKELAIGN